VKRQINRRRQGDLGEASAIEWLTSVGATVLVPLGHSPDFDLVAEANGRLLRIQVKTSTQLVTTPDGHRRSAVSLATRGGNQSWNGIVRKFDPSRFDYLFALTGDGRRWFIPSTALEARTSISLGGPKYAQFEIEPGRGIHELVYGADPHLKSRSPAGEYPSGQRGGAVNAMAMPSQVRILPPPSTSPASAFRDHEPEPVPELAAGQAVIWAKRRMTIPRFPFGAAGLGVGDTLRVQAAGNGRLVLERVEPP
jgi:PD-(D/E)XK endonuclease